LFDGIDGAAHAIDFCKDFPDRIFELLG